MVMGIVSSKLRASAKGQPCALAIPGICSHDPEQTVLCHLPSEVKGGATKSDDFFACFGCLNCHQSIDNHRLSREESLYYSLRALARTWRFWVTSGLISVAENTARPKALSKTVARRHIATGKPI
jgi:hypothetical protein